MPADAEPRPDAQTVHCTVCGAPVAPLPTGFAQATTAAAVSPAAVTGLRTASVPGPLEVTSFALIDRDRFEIVREIASGGMGRVLEAWDRRHARIVALKIMLHPDSAMRARFAREARITGSLQHPGIVPLYETGRWSDDEPFLVMKLVRGRPLDEVVETTPERQRPGLLPNVIAMTEALAFAHEKGVIHRDLKPANVLVGSFGETIVIDWGIAKAIGEPEPAEALRGGDRMSASPALTQAGVALGTPYYMPPEQARGDQADARADVYSLGALLYHVLGGQPPYRGASHDILDRVLAGPPAPLRSLVPQLAPDLLAIVDKAMARDPDARYPDARAMAEDLRRFEAGKLVAAHIYSLPTLIARWVARHRAVVGMTAALVLAVGLTAGISVTRVVRERDRADAANIEANRQRAVAVTQRDAAERLVGYLIGELRDRLDRLGKLDLLAGLGGEVEAYYRTLAPSNDLLDAPALRRRASALEVLYGVEAHKRNIPGATTLMHAALDARIAEYALAPDDLQSMTDLALSRALMATLLEGDEAAAESERAAAVAGAIEARSDVPPSAHVIVGYARALLASAAASASQLDRARGLSSEARTAFASVGDPFHGLDALSQDRLARAQFTVAAIGFQTQDEWPAVIESLRSSVAIRRAQRERDPDHAAVLSELAISLRWLGEAYEQNYEDRQALAASREALEIERTLVQRDPGNVVTSQELVGTLISMCLLGREWEGPAAVYPSCAEARSLARRLSDAHPADRLTWNLLARALRASGESALVAHRGAEAEGLFQAAVDASRRALHAAAKSRELQTELADCLHDVGRAELALGRPDAARARYREAMAIEEPQLAASADTSNQVFVGELWMLIGDTERGDEARADYGRAVALFMQAHEGAPDDVEPALDLARASRKLSATERDERARSELARRAAELIAPHVAAGRVSPEWRAELEAAGRPLVP
jgi:tetratricopeptide (TPR) repeat protein/predicted Ser/Thr protein kinase